MNIHLQDKPPGHAKLRCGFALIASLSLMALLVMVALAMLSLAAVELRSSGREDAMNTARANARMALMIAIGELQQKAGPDTRVTAPGDIVAGGDGSHRVTGAWRSWEGLDHDATIGLPGYDSSKDNAATPEQEGSIAPDYSIKTVDYDADNPKEGRFLGWLVSEQGSWSATNAPQLDERVGSSVPLLTSGTLANNTEGNEVHVIPTPSTANEGSFAWWVSGENQKANLSEPASAPESNEEWDQHLTSAGRPDATFFGLSTPDELSNAVSNDSLDLLSKAADAPEKLGGENFHHLTVHSKGLLTNTATGGWRRDLSLMTEQWDDLPDTGLPFYTIQPGVESSAVKADRDYITSNHLIYPWAETATNYRPSGDFQSRKSDAVTSWSGLRDFCVQYKSITSGGASGQVEMPANRGGKPRQSRWVASGDITEIRDQSDRFPVMARMHWVFSYSSKRNPNQADATADNAYIACIVATPVITMWNPYNVSLEVADLSIVDRQMSPLAIQVQVGDRDYPEYPISSYCAMIFGQNTKYDRVITSLEDTNGNTTIVFKPGETHIFTPYQGLEDQSGREDGKIMLTLRSGYRTQQGFRFELSNPDTEQLITGKAGDTFKVVVTAQGRLWRNNTDRDRPSLDGWRLGADIEFQAAAVPGGTIRTAAHYNCITNKDSAKTFWPDEDLVLENNDETLGVLEGRSDAFAASLFGYRVSNKGNIPSKGVLQCNPVANRSSGDWNTGGGNNMSTGLGARHPVNWPYDFEFVMLNGWNDPGCPSGITGETTGYIGPSHQFSVALDRLVMAHAPLRPIQSLAQLQHLNLRQGNPIGPYQYNIIGNSHAQPIFDPDSTLSHRVNQGANAVKLAFYHQYDDSYIANHLLFDDWFVSSIAPDTNAYSAAENRGLEEVYEDHLTGATALPNHRYLPAPPQANTTSQAAEDLATTTDWKPWYHIASKLEVHGMFNVNSTSVEAWTALLRHLKDAEVPTLDREGSISLDNGGGYPLGRDALAGEAVAGGSTNNSGEGFTEATEYTGYRRFTDAQIDALARQMVEEIKARGPFLSLSEFINRRLTADPGEENLARAGVIEAALLYLSEQGSSSDNPYRELQAVAGEVTAAPPGDHAYRFPYAALGSTAYGFPGWTRQADVLRPLAPVLSARDDTFTIRAYGDAKNSKGEVIARAWCEAIVKRSADYVDTTDANTDLPGSGGDEDKSVNPVNEKFGRRFDVISFRWLTDKAV